jgi:ubiquinone/menaquinone biosynthesis C-methylase UbiE
LEDYQLLIDLHKDADRQGPGGEAQTAQAITLARLEPDQPLKIADIGCGTGASTLVLARALNAKITAVDFLQDFLDRLEANAQQSGLADKITTHCCSMDALPFTDEQFDVIWSEGAIYNIGFEKGVANWRRYLKAGGLLVASEITWITASRPAEIETYWTDEYPEIDVASAKIAVLEKHGYSPIGYFTLPPSCWLENYYEPMKNRLERFLDRHGNSEEARAIAAAETQEIALYEKYRDYYSYGVYIAKKCV